MLLALHSGAHHASLDGITQQRIDAGLPARPCGLECVQHIRVNAHVQGGALYTHGPRLMVAVFQ